MLLIVAAVGKLAQSACGSRSLNWEHRAPGECSYLQRLHRSSGPDRSGLVSVLTLVDICTTETHRFHDVNIAVFTFC